MSQVWSTTDVHPRDRLAYWIDGLARNVTTVECEPRRDQPFFGEIRAEVLGPIGVMTYSSVPQVFAQSQPRAVFTLGLQMEGHGLGSQDGRDTTLNPGELVLYDATRAFRLAFYSSFVRIKLTLPRSALVQRVGSTEHLIGRRIDGTAGVGALLAALLRDLPRRADAIPATVRGRVAEHLMDLIATALLVDDADAPLSTSRTLAHIKAWIDAHLGEALSVEGIAKACRLSTRHLNRLFEREGTPLMHYVWGRRLARCHRDLTDQAMRKRPVSDIAFSAGFNDLSHFSRAYRARYGCTPRDMAARAKSPPPSNPAAAAGRRGQLCVVCEVLDFFAAPFFFCLGFLASRVERFCSLFAIATSH